MPLVSWWCGSSVFGKSPKQLENFAPVQGAQNLGCCRVVGGLHCEAAGYGCFKRMKIGGWCGYVVIFVEP